jgi:hypothetical protein
MRVLCVALLSLWSLSSFAGEGGFPFGMPPKQAKQEWREKINAALSAKASVDFKATPLHDVIATFKQKSAANFILDPKSTPAESTKVTHKQDGILGDVMKATLKTVGLDFSVRDGVVFVFDPKKVDMEMVKSEDMLVARMLEGRPERLDFQPKGEPAGELLKQLTEPANIKLGMVPELQKVPITLDLKDVSLGHALRWLVRLSGGKFEVTAREGNMVVKR